MSLNTLHTPIGCLGGSFNPPHTAHFALAHSAREQLGLVQVLMIPAGQPWQKPHVLPATHRTHMLRTALEDDARIWHAHQKTSYPLILDTVESDLAHTSYTINTLQSLRVRYPNTPLIWIMGSDQLRNLHTWQNWQSLLNYAHIAVAQRAGHMVDLAELTQPLQHVYQEHVVHSTSSWHQKLCGHFIPFTLTALHISSSSIRSAIQNGMPAHDLPELHTGVADYITAHHLYQHQENI